VNDALNPPGQILSTYPSPPDGTRLGVVTQVKENHYMENRTQDEELKAHLLATNEQFRSLSEQHAHLKHQIEEIESRPHVTEADELEEQRLKKLKLSLKDQMREIMARYSHTGVPSA
jgi:uncharacterized protein YdcH (DUF465 family)